MNEKDKKDVSTVESILSTTAILRARAAGVKINVSKPESEKGEKPETPETPETNALEDDGMGM